MTTPVLQARVLARIDFALNEITLTTATLLYGDVSDEQFLRALRVAVGFHELRHYKPGFRDVKGTLHFEICAGCSDRAQEPVKFPCPELRDIAREMGKDMTQSRKHRGYRSQRAVALLLNNSGFPFAEPAGAGRSGTDITGTIGIDWEIKARANFSPAATMKQLRERAIDDDLRIAVLRLNGQGEAHIGQWVCLIELDQMLELLDKAGFGGV